MSLKSCLWLSFQSDKILKWQNVFELFMIGQMACYSWVNFALHMFDLAWSNHKKYGLNKMRHTLAPLSNHCKYQRVPHATLTKVCLHPGCTQTRFNYLSKFWKVNKKIPEVLVGSDFMRFRKISYTTLPAKGEWDSALKVPRLWREPGNGEVGRYCQWSWRWAFHCPHDRHVCWNRSSLRWFADRLAQSAELTLSLFLLGNIWLRGNNEKTKKKKRISLTVLLLCSRISW